VPVFKEERVNTEGSRSISNIKAAPLNQQRMATPIPASRHWTRSSLEMGANGSMCMTVHIADTPFAGMTVVDFSTEIAA